MEAMLLRKLVFPAVSALALLAASGEARASQPLTAFESGQVRPMAMSPNGQRLFVVNTPDNRLEIYAITPAGLEREASVAVGLEPVAVAARNNHEVWVVNHLSDSVSVVAVGAHAHVKRTLQVGDEPRDIVFAGVGGERAFITAAHRGQHAPFDPQLTTPSVGRADVWVFQASQVSAEPLTIVNLFSDTPRALAVNADGSRVYAAAFNSGNQTATIAPGVMPKGGEQAGGLPGPNVNHAGIGEPDNGLIVRFDGDHWVDELGRVWDHMIKFNLPDKDVFVINAEAPVPALLPDDDGFFAGVGTTLFNMIVNPVSGKIYVTNTEARNQVRFEGPGIFADTTVRGHAVDNRITVLDDQGVHPRLLNKHIDYDNCCAPVPNAESELSVSQPLGMATTSDGAVLYTAVIGNDKVAIYYTAELEDDSFYPDAFDQIPVSGGGPTGLVLDEANDRLYVMTRFDNGISIIDTDALEEVDHLTMHNPEPADLIAGRRFLYDAALTSSHGDQSCASCHIFGDKDDLAWDLGNPDGDIMAVTDNIRTNFGIGDIDFHPMKGPMLTQSLRGLDNHGPMHWRGDRNGVDQQPSAQPDTGAYSEVAAFNTFNVAFPGLLGRDQELAPEQMQAFTDFALQLVYPPNPIRNLDNSLTAQQQVGRDFFFNNKSVITADLSQFTCENCHRIDAQANAEYGVARPGFFGSDGQLVLAELGQTLKIPQMRNFYTRVGAFGMVGGDAFFNSPGQPFYDDSHQGDQVRGFGYAHDGSKDQLLRIFNGFSFAAEGFHDIDTMLAVASFLFAFDTNLAPVVGQQVTLRKQDFQLQAWAAVNARINLLRARADADECELIAKTRLGPFELGLLYEGGAYTTSFSGLPSLTHAQVRLLALSSPVTYTCVPLGTGERLGIDRDDDGTRDGDEQLWWQW
ncbi:beta-propeller fold lactonase family protein [Enhygromyxa salina]|uniref:Lactonase, 7-bladed beta-propeller n=1 Tax=Enhygromyxa salina TaxID=215803 RepID=A0A2S9YA69_9BACT|nr:beta-propeller fold lactonase family protein [Enhygromyxa salina]PRQ02008.1 Lactonase, 7-bladed beta-propeller [Enhygromyxa salina]